MNDTRTIFFIGKPGCGKGTQAKLLSEKMGWQVISAGSQFRALAAEDTPVGRKIKSEINAGDLAPHWFAMYLYLKALFAVGTDAPIIFDGFNRKVPEAELVVSSLTWLGRPFVVIHIVVSDTEVERRLAGRKVVEGRADDNAVDERLKEYREYTAPAIELFRREGTLIEVNGEQTPEEIALEVNAALKI
ncbi:MAG: nucleoside monophosphate kinase [Patescibacteria group bacterium]